jgi:putative Mg2+ transporter-C (MgtC) family protein
LDILTFSLRLTVAFGLGTLVGFERQQRQGLTSARTNALVAVGAAQFVMLSELIGTGDPTRIAAQVVSSIGFLGAGVILRTGFHIRGFNTAATLWGVAAVGSLADAGFLLESAVGATSTLLANLLLRLPKTIQKITRKIQNYEIR